VADQSVLICVAQLFLVDSGGGVLFRIQKRDGIGSLPCHRQLGRDGPAGDRYAVLLRDWTGELS